MVTSRPLDAAASPEIERLLPALVYIQARCDLGATKASPPAAPSRAESRSGDGLSLEELARRVHLSAHHFQKLFKRLIGETPKQYTTRLRLERAAFLLLVERSTILKVAIDCGFASHETFSRAFRRHFGCSPREFRRRPWPERRRVPQARLEAKPGHWEISETKLRRLEPMELAFIRHTGPYEEVPGVLWDQLQSAAIPAAPADFLLGIAHDVPGITDEAKLRFDAALQVDRPFSATGRIGHQHLDVGWCACTVHVGHYASLPSAYQEIGARLATWQGFLPAGPPTLEIFRTTRINEDLGMNETEICIPVRKVASRPPPDRDSGPGLR